MKRNILAALAAALLCIGLATGCAQNQTTETDATPASGDKIKVVCSIFPAYDWTMQVIGDQAENYDVTYLLQGGVDLHSYQPSVSEMAEIADADLFVYVGGESDGWAEDAVEAADSTDLHVVNMLDAVGDRAVEEELVEGMEGHDHEHEEEHSEEAHEEEHSEEAHEEEHSEEGPEYDEHVWLSLRNASVLVDAIAHELSAIDADNAQTYADNAKAYNEQLADLDTRYEKTVDDASGRTVVFADRFPFRYLAEDYDLSYYAAFVGCSAETEASFETIAFLAQKIDELGLTHVLVIEGSDQKLAKTVIENTKDKNQQILVMDSLQSATADDIAAGKTYLKTMEDNLAVLGDALR